MLLIKNAKIVQEQKEILTDVLINKGFIEKIEKDIVMPKEARIIDAKKAYLLPGLIDLNVRLANSELNKDSLEKLTKTSLKGGVTTSLIMPDFSPRLDSSTLLEHFMIKADKEKADLHVAAPLESEETERLNNIATLINNGAKAIWTKSASNSNILKRGFQYARMKKATIFCSCYDPNLDDEGVMNEGEVSFQLGLSGISKISESAEVAKVAEISLINNTKIIFQSLSTKRSIDLISDIKKTNKNIFTEVAIHHLCKNDTACDGFNTYAKIQPPLREEEERKALLQELRDGNIDILTSAHSPRSVLYKDVAFEEAAFGIGSIEEYLSLCYTYLVKPGHISMQHLIEMTSKKPAELLNMENVGAIQEGFQADLILFDPSLEKKEEKISSIYKGEVLFGEVKKVIKNGEVQEF